jgi:hypothetical protein
VLPERVIDPVKHFLGVVFMKDEKTDEILRAASLPVIVLAFLPLWLVISSFKIWIEPDPRLLVGAMYASVMTLSFIYFGLQLRKIKD